MSTRFVHIFMLTLLAVGLAASAFAYSQLPNEIAVHWNIHGVADGYGDKFWGIFLFPMLLAGLYALYAAIPVLDPLRANIKRFRPQFNLFFVAMAVFFAYIFTLVLGWNFGWQFNFGLAMLPACAVLLWTIGTLVQKAEPNWFVGIRTPWTLTNEKVWHKTHALGGRLFKAAAVLPLVGMLFGPEAGFYLFMGAVGLVSVVTVVYSYVMYKNEKRK